ncbi:hypothetical protein BWR19_04095 [Halomonas sp. 1513]|nr:hypothetical protein BWR19_04095 [Halomonas sp. 1513]
MKINQLLHKIPYGAVVTTASLLASHSVTSDQAHKPAGGAFSLQVSTPELAVLERIAVTPNELLFGSELVDTLGGLNTLRLL